MIARRSMLKLAGMAPLAGAVPLAGRGSEARQQERADLELRITAGLIDR